MFKDLCYKHSPVGWCHSSTVEALTLVLNWHADHVNLRQHYLIVNKVQCLDVQRYTVCYSTEVCDKQLEQLQAQVNIGSIWIGDHLVKCIPACWIILSGTDLIANIMKGLFSNAHVMRRILKTHASKNSSWRLDWADVSGINILKFMENHSESLEEARTLVSTRNKLH